MMLDEGPIREAQSPRPRIKTQIHRRKKAEAFSALEPEWDRADRVPPSHLRMPSNRMAPTMPRNKQPPKK
jgi:hypothetical protein